MDDCISRQALLSEIEKVCFGKDFVKFRIDNGSNGTRDYMIKYIEDMPPVQPEQKVGKWIIVDDCEQFIAKCSECGRIEDSRMINKYPYCHCGAKMQEVKE